MSNFRGSPMRDEDREHLDGFKWTPELFADYAARARAQADRYTARRNKAAGRRELDAGERYFDRRGRRRPEIWLPPGSRNREESAE